jgi:hypothetical protein
MNALFQLTRWLALPLALLLFAQWPLRQWLGLWSREANDLAQILFALYAAVAVTAAGRAGVHLAAHPAGTAHPAGSPKRRVALCLCVLPWALFVLGASTPGVWASWLQLEKFPETLNPGYFLIRSAAWLLAVLALIDAGWQLVQTHAARQHP